MKTAIGLMLVLALVGCGDDPTVGTRQDDAGAGGAQVGDAGPGGNGGAAPVGGGGSGGTGGAATGTGGAMVPGTGGVTGSGGAQGSGGAVGSGGATGTGGANGGTETCVDPMGWKIGGGLNCEKTKGGRVCFTNCISVRPNGQAGNYIGPPMHPECVTADLFCVASCSECP